jgi:hypothetical protein
VSTTTQKSFLSSGYPIAEKLIETCIEGDFFAYHSAGGRNDRDQEEDEGWEDEEDWEDEVDDQGEDDAEDEENGDDDDDDDEDDEDDEEPR